MREILFRGKRVDNGEWVEGYFCEFANNRTGEQETYIQTVKQDGRIDLIHKVAPSTIGQYTGVNDKNGNRIFEGDVVAQNWYDFDEPADDSFGEVVFSVADCSFSILDFNKNEIMPMGQGCAYHWEAEVIGNIHDNPELLKDGDG